MQAIRLPSRFGSCFSQGGEYEKMDKLFFAFLFSAGLFGDAVKSGMAGFPLPYFWSGMRIASIKFFPEAKAL